jgi:cell wall-associated NlpC family hydrolase
VRLQRICVVAAVALGTTPAAALAGTRHSHVTRAKKSHGNRTLVRTADSGTGGASAGGSSGSYSQPSQTSQTSQTSPDSGASPGAAQGDPNSSGFDQTGGQAYNEPTPAQAQTAVPGAVAKVLPDGLAAAPADAPPAVQQSIWAANKIIGMPYVYGGGHQAFQASGYDCSGTVSYALHGGNLLTSPLDSSEFMTWGERGKGQWITVYTNPGHAYVVLAGLRLDTSTAGDPHGLNGPRWRPTLRSSRGFRARHLGGS